jgi:hypothetical protein
MADIYPTIRSRAIDCGKAAPGKFSVLDAVPDQDWSRLIAPPR